MIIVARRLLNGIATNPSTSNAIPNNSTGTFAFLVDAPHSDLFARIESQFVLLDEIGINRIDLRTRIKQGESIMISDSDRDGDMPPVQLERNPWRHAGYRRLTQSHHCNGNQ